jgi:hypothetical protein
VLTNNTVLTNKTVLTNNTALTNNPAGARLSSSKRGGRFEAKGVAGVGVRNLDGLGVQVKAPARFGCVSIKPITDDGVSDRGQVNPQLMGAARMWKQPQSGSIRIS